MPAVELLFSDIAEIVREDGRAIDNQALRDADALLCRSITEVDETLLKNTKIKFVGSATVGIDHLNINYLESNNIKWSNAAGCNAVAVAQYVLSAIAYWCQSRSRKMQGLKVGIVGAGNVGSELARCLDALGIDCLLCDPPLQHLGDIRPLISMQEILDCDVISLHVPLTIQGDYPTKYLFGQKELNRLDNDQLLVNTSRGEVIDNHVLEAYLSNTNHADVVLDVFENEPNISVELVDKCLLATPHIAGHTLEGKVRGTWMIYKAFCKHFGLDLKIEEDGLYPKKENISLINDLENDLLVVYDIFSDSSALKLDNDETIKNKFDRLRKNATQLVNGKVRRDYSGWNYVGEHVLPL